MESQQEQKVEEASSASAANRARNSHRIQNGGMRFSNRSKDGVERSTRGRFFTKKDALYLGALVLVYTIIALFHLGGHKAPTTFWKPTSAGETVIADLGSPHNITRINTFAGVGEGSYSFWFSQDGSSGRIK